MFIEKLTEKTQKLFEAVVAAIPDKSTKQQAELIDKMDAYIVLRDGLEWALNELSKQEKEIRQLMLEYGVDGSIEIGGYSFTVVNRTAPTISWDTKALETLARQESEKYGWLLDYRRETPAKPYATIKPSLRSKF